MFDRLTPHQFAAAYLTFRPAAAPPDPAGPTLGDPVGNLAWLNRTRSAQSLRPLIPPWLLTTAKPPKRSPDNPKRARRGRQH